MKRMLRSATPNHQVVSHYFQGISAYLNDPHLKAAFTFQDIYMGLSPFEAPATFSMMPYSELALGVWYPRGGMYRVVEALGDLARAAGVEFLFNAPVHSIDIDNSNARSVLFADCTRLEGDAILANADLPYVYQDLLPRDRQHGAFSHKRFSCSVISFFWGVDKVYKSIGPHTLFIADDYRENFESIDRDCSLPANPSLYVQAPARLDASMAPPGEDTLTAIVPVGHMSDEAKQDWCRLREEARQHVFRRLRTLGITDLESHIKFEESLIPPSWCKRYNLVKGATHGLAHTLTQMAYFRPANRHPRYGNLCFVGTSTHPGTGMPTAMVSGRLVAEMIMEELEP